MAFSPFMTLTLRRLQPISPVLCENSCCVTMTALDSEFYKGGRFWNGQRTFMYKWKLVLFPMQTENSVFKVTDAERETWRYHSLSSDPLLSPEVTEQWDRRRWRTPGPQGRKLLHSELAGWFCCCNPLSVVCLDLLSTEKVLKTWRDFVHLLSKDRMPSFLPHCMVLSIKHYRRRLWNVVAYMFFF